MRQSSIIQFISVWAILLFTGGLCAGAAEFAGGTGEPNDPYLIATAEQLLGADFSVPEVYFQLVDDIDLDGKPGFDFYGWPHYYDEFRAHLDGAGFEIRNAVCSVAGVFGYVASGASIANLTLSHIEVIAARDPDYGASEIPAGAFAMINEGAITNCGVTGLVTTWRISKVGGFVGRNWGTIVNSYFDGWVLAPWADIDTWDEYTSVYVGGLVCVNDANGVIANCVSRGTVLGNRGVGGLVGLNWGAIRNGYSRCEVLADSGAGGLVSENKGSLDTCYAANRVTGALRGGLVGMAGEGENIGIATNCIWGYWDTECDQSGAGVCIEGIITPAFLALNGWAGDPNWVIPTDPCYPGFNPRLAWETEGTLIPEFDLPELNQGSGTESDPYVISTRETLRALAKASIFWDKHFILANDMDTLGGIRPIGICAGSSFSGTFDGNGHVIHNMGTGSTWDAVWNSGLFGYVTGEVRNVTLENGRIRGGQNSHRIGLLAGTNAGTVANCFVSGSIVVGAYSRFVGELIGVNFKEGEVVDCDSLVTIEAGEGSTEVGGLIGADDAPFRR